jgi:hypothetical protein
MTAPKSHPVPAFFDMGDGILPMPLLSFQAEMIYQPCTPVIVSAMEEMATSPASTKKLPSVHFAPRPPKLARLETEIILPEASDGQLQKRQRLEHSPAPSESSLSSLDEDLVGSGKVPKPHGEAGRPGRGGYNLEEKLGWGEHESNKLKVGISEEALQTKIDTINRTDFCAQGRQTAPRYHQVPKSPGKKGNRNCKR